MSNQYDTVSQDIVHEDLTLKLFNRHTQNGEIFMSMFTLIQILCHNWSSLTHIYSQFNKSIG